MNILEIRIALKSHIFTLIQFSSVNLKSVFVEHTIRLNMILACVSDLTYHTKSPWISPVPLLISTLAVSAVVCYVCRDKSMLHYCTVQILPRKLGSHTSGHSLWIACGDTALIRDSLRFTAIITRYC